MKTGDLVTYRQAWKKFDRGAGIVLKVRIGAHAGPDKRVVQVKWPEEAPGWHAACVLEVVI